MVAVVEVQGHGGASVCGSDVAGRYADLGAVSQGEQTELADGEKECGREVKGESRRAALASVTRSLRLLMSILNTFPCLPSGLR